MHGSLQDLGDVRTPARRTDGSPWAVALNSTAASDGVCVTLLALAVVDDVVHVSGVIRFVGRPNVQLASIPTLDLASSDGPLFDLVRAHGLPNGRQVWVSWTYERPAGFVSAREARIDRIDLAYRAGGLVREAVSGPWIFALDLSDVGSGAARSVSDAAAARAR